MPDPTPLIHSPKIDDEPSNLLCLHTDPLDLTRARLVMDVAVSTDLAVRIIGLISAGGAPASESRPAAAPKAPTPRGDDRDDDIPF